MGKGRFVGLASKLAQTHGFHVPIVKITSKHHAMALLFCSVRRGFCRSAELLERLEVLKEGTEQCLQFEKLWRMEKLDHHNLHVMPVPALIFV